MHPRSSIPPTRDYQASSRRGSVAGWLVALLVVAGIVVGIAYGAYELADATAEPKARALTREVKKADLVITVTEDGNIESASNVEVKCQVAGGTSILWIVPDGEFVKDGQKIVELDSSALEESINQQRITFEKAKSAKIQAEKDYAVSKIAVTEYLEGVYKKELQDAGAQIKISLENLRTAQNSLAYTTRMFRKGYVSSLDLESQQFSVQRAQLELDSANTAKDVLVRFTKEKNLQELESQRDTAESRKDSETAAFELEEKRLKRLEDQMRLCIINAPASGMVVYANERGGRFGSQQSVTIEEGAAASGRRYSASPTSNRCR
ncbi:MAG: TolC family protein [Pirellulaceae bacterium]|nr:TolC family protein [Pirellulaceae bacterium]